MKPLVATIAAAFAFLLILVAISEAAPKRRQHCPKTRAAIVDARASLWRLQDRYGLERTRVSSEPVHGCAYARWVRDLWRGRGRALHRIGSDPVAAIRYVFGPYGDQAVRVSSCETGGTFHVGAQNGQYLGLFQMGEFARSTYGHSGTPIGQARAAYRYFVASGRDWSPWSCKP